MPGRSPRRRGSPCRGCSSSRAASFATRLEPLGEVADELARLHLFGLPDDHDERYRKELAEITPPLALKAASDHLRSGHEVIVVAGDAAVIGPMLSHFGEVKVVDPTRAFARIRTLPMDANAPLEIPRQEGRESRSCSRVREASGLGYYHTRTMRPGSSS